MNGLPRNVLDDPTLRNRTGVFADRCEAGIMLARFLRKTVAREPLLLAIPSGGVPVAVAMKRELGGALGLMPVRKLAIPFEPEAGFGALSLDGETVLNEDLVGAIGLTNEQIDRSISLALSMLRRRMRLFGSGGELPDIRGKSVILVDDGLASGYTMLAAVRSARKRLAAEVGVAVPTGSLAAVAMVAPEASWVCCLNVRGGPSFAVADAYREWYDVPDAEAALFLRQATRRGP